MIWPARGYVTADVMSTRPKSALAISNTVFSGGTGKDAAGGREASSIDVGG